MIRSFKDLKFKPLYDGVSSVVKFGDYELSVVKHGSSYGNKMGLYEIGVFYKDKFKEMPGITEEGDTIKGFLTEEDVSGIIKKMHLVSASDGEQL
jgi:hypothetical protein